MSKRSLETSGSHAKRQRAEPAAAQQLHISKQGHSNRKNSSTAAPCRSLQQHRQFIANINQGRSACAGMKRSGGGSKPCLAAPANAAANNTAAVGRQRSMQQSAATSKGLVGSRSIDSSSVGRHDQAAQQVAVAAPATAQQQHAKGPISNNSSNTKNGYSLLGPCPLLPSLAQSTSNKDISFSNEQTTAPSTPQPTRSKAVKQPPVVVSRSVDGAAAVAKQQPVRQQQQPGWRLSTSINSKLGSVNGSGWHQQAMQTHKAATRTAEVSKLAVAGQQQGHVAAEVTSTKLSSDSTTTCSTAAAEDVDAAAMVFKRRPSQQSSLPVSSANNQQQQQQRCACDSRHDASVATKTTSAAAVACKVNASVKKQQFLMASSGKQQTIEMTQAKAKTAAAPPAVPVIPVHRRKLQAKRSVGLSRLVNSTAADCVVVDDVDAAAAAAHLAESDQCDKDYDPVHAELASFGCPVSLKAKQTAAAGVAAAADPDRSLLKLLTESLMDTLAAVECGKKMSSEQQASWQKWQQAAEEQSVLPEVPHLQQTAADAVAAFARSCTAVYLIDGAASDVLWTASTPPPAAAAAAAAITGCDSNHNQSGRRVLRAKRTSQGNGSTTAAAAAAGPEAQVSGPSCSNQAAATSDRCPLRGKRNLESTPASGSDGSSSSQNAKRVKIKFKGLVNTGSRLQNTGVLGGSSSSAGGHGGLTGKAAAYAVMLAAEDRCAAVVAPAVGGQ